MTYTASNIAMVQGTMMHEHHNGAKLVAHVSKQRMWLIALLALGFAAMGLWFTTAASEIARTVRFVFFRDPFILRVFGWAAVLIGVSGAVVSLRQLFRTGPVMEVDTRGILWRRWSPRVIPWTAITDATSRTLSNQRFLCLMLDRPGDYRGKSMTGLLAGLNKNMGYGDVAISMQGTDRRFDELVEAVSRYRPVAKD